MRHQGRVEADIPLAPLADEAPLYTRPTVESPKGELGFYIVSDGTPQPWRYHVRAPSLINLTVLEEMCLGQKIADAIIVLGSIDIVLGETDR